MEPQPAKRPKFNDPSIHHDLPVGWRFGRADKHGPWAWSNHSCETLLETIAKLADLESMREDEWRQRGCHPVPLEQLCKDAHNRLRELDQDDLDELMSFRLSGAERVWCIRDRNVMRVLWWDPQHEVCPSLLKNT